MAKKLQLGYREIEQRLADSFADGVNAAEVGYKLLYSFGKSERDIGRYKEGKGVLKTFDGLLIKGLFCYQPVSMFGLTSQLEALKSNQQIIKAAPKIIAVSDGKSILAYDLREKDTYENQLERLPSDFAFFYPLMDVERVHYVEESPADIKAAEKLAKLHDELRSYNEFRSNDDLHDLNIFISRLLFCFFAEDTGIFEENLFTSSIQRYTKEDGSDLTDYLAHQGMHYTSVPNIMKVINPLFLDELRGEYNKLNEFYEQKLQMKNIGALSVKQFYEDLKPVIKKGDALLKRMSRMKFFDPACGSGNFLIITYKCLRFLEMDILALQRKCTPEGEIMFVDNSVISLSQFYGIELLDFPHEIAMLSLWLAEHQMNTKLNENFGVNTKALPLKNITQIVCGNACRIDWNEVCSHTPDEEVYIFGNPPYLGSSMQDKGQKKDMEIVCGGFDNYKNLDYIACWFYVAAKYIRESNAKYAFVCTNSLTQGEQVALLWPNIFDLGLEIDFAYHSFKWNNNAKYNAAVIVVIIGLCKKGLSKKTIYTDSSVIQCTNINPYLLNAPNIIIGRTTYPISDLPEMIKGSMPTDGGYLLMEQNEKDELLTKYPYLNSIVKGYMGSDDFLNGKRRYCLWMNKEQYNLYKDIPELSKRFEGVARIRLESDTVTTQEYAQYPYLFRQPQYKETDSIIVTGVSSEKREYVPAGLLDKDVVISNAAFAIYDADIYTFGLVSSKIHMVWMKTTCGRLEMRYRYSPTLCYNTFPFPQISAEKKQEIEAAAEEVLITREYYPEKTLAELYDPDKMPDDLREAHAKLDDIVESCYPGYPFASDEARLECLFKLYEKMTATK